MPIRPSIKKYPLRVKIGPISWIKELHKYHFIPLNITLSTSNSFSDPLSLFLVLAPVGLWLARGICGRFTGRRHRWPLYAPLHLSLLLWRALSAHFVSMRRSSHRCSTTHYTGVQCDGELSSKVPWSRCGTAHTYTCTTRYCVSGSTTCRQLLTEDPREKSRVQLDTWTTHHLLPDGLDSWRVCSKVGWGNLKLALGWPTYFPLPARLWFGILALPQTLNCLD